MMSKDNQNRIRFYLDQNVIDYLIKGNLNSVQELINKMPNSEIIYSYVTLREFARIEEESHRRLYLDYLKRVDAKYFWIDENELANFENADPFEKYEANTTGRDKKVYKEVEDSMLQMMHKLLGGKKDISFDEIANAQKNSFSQLTEYLNSIIASLDGHPAIDKESLAKHCHHMNSYFGELVDKSTLQVRNSDYNKDNPLNELRKLCDIKVDELNKIEPPNVIDKIWDLLTDGIRNTNSNITYDDLFGGGLYKYFSYKKVTMIMKVNGLYNMMNNIGYYPDKNIRNDRKFIPFINDQQHVGHAIYSNFFVTRDKRLMKKAEAVYEHLKIRTKIIFVE